MTDPLANTTLLFRVGDAAEDAGDFYRAHQSFLKGAELGDPVCWTRLGSLYDCGIGCAINKTEAMRCYLRAWRHQDAVAANNIAILYKERHKFRSMIRWYEKAALAGDASAWIEIAKCLAKGVGVSRSVQQALECIDKALASEYLSGDEIDEAERLAADLRQGF